jgi:superfamily II helicase
MLRVCKKCHVEKDLELFAKHKKCNLGRLHECKDCKNKYLLQRYYKNPEKYVEVQKKSLSKRKSEGKDVHKPTKDYRKRYPERHNAKQRERAALKLNRIPSWATDQDRKDIVSMYALAKKLEAVFGVKYHVDHIVPLKGKNVCGLHTPNNLQILESSLNMRKSNKSSW